MEDNKNTTTLDNDSVENVVEDTTSNASSSKTPEKSSNTKSEKTAEEQIAEMRVQMAKLKRATDRATAEASNYKKQLREKQSADEIALQEKAEAEAKRDEEFNEMKKKLEIHDLTENFMSLGYDKNLALKAANASYENDREELFRIQTEFMNAHDNALKSELYKTIPELNAGVGADRDCPVTKEQFAKMGYTARVEFKQKYPDMYKKYTQR